MASHQDADFDALLEQSSLGGPAASRLRARTPLSWAWIVRRITERRQHSRGSRGEQDVTAIDRQRYQQLIAQMVNLAHGDGMDMFDALPDDKQAPMLYAHQQYELLVLSQRCGVISLEEVLGYLRELAHNPLFREYWGMTREHRRSIPQDSDEAAVQRAVDELVEELADDCDEWWVAGLPNDS